MSDTASDPNPTFDPTESTRTLTSAPFKESYMSLREHQDTDRHYIGDALPMPSQSQVAGSSNFSSVGVLPFPARVDHSHELKMTYGFFNAGNKTFPPGGTIFNNLSWTGWGRNMLATTQVLAFPYRGAYLVETQIAISRDAGGIFTNEMNIRHYYNNGSNNKTILRQSNFDIPTNFFITYSDVIINNTAPSTNDNLQIAIEHNDSSNWTASIQQMFVFRLCGDVSN